jgi:hypothetical protein
MCQRYHRIYLEDFVSQRGPRSLQEKHLEVQFNSQDVFGYILGFNYTSKDKAFTILNVAKLSTFEYQVTDVWH